MVCIQLVAVKEVLKLMNRKIEDWKITDQVTRVENAGL